MESYKLWREVVESVSEEYPDVLYSSMYADNCAYQLVKNRQFDVIVGCNFWAIFSLICRSFVRSLGMLPSAYLCDVSDAPVAGIYEPVHGSA